MWSRTGELYDIIDKNKKDFGEIPVETCPLIDEVIDIIKKHGGYEDGRLKELMEDIRSHNSKLRHLGLNWYIVSQEVSAKGDKIIEELEDEYKELEKETDNLKYQLKNIE